MTPFEELAAGEPMGDAMYRLLVKIVRQSTSMYPPPAGYASWTNEAAREWLHGYFFPKKGELVAQKFLNTAVDDATLVMVARKAVRRALTDEARATTAGKMVGRLATLLPREGFVDAKGILAGTPAWSLPELGDAIYHGDWSDLLRSPQLKGIPPISQLNSQGTTSRANIDSLVGAVRGLLTAAGGAMPARDLATAVVELFELDDPTMYSLRDADRDSDTDMADASPDDEQRSVHEEVDGVPITELVDRGLAYDDADRIWAALTDDEKRLVGYLDTPPLWKPLFRGRADVTSVASSLRTKLASMLDAEPVASGALDIVLARSVYLTRNES